MAKRFSLLFVAMICAVTSLWAAKADKQVSITVNGQARSYRIYVPTNAKANAPLVFSLHGTGGSMDNKSPFSTSVADKYGCIVVYPQGETMNFPAFGNMSLPGWHSTGEYTKDIDFFKAIIEDVNKSYTIDRTRIYCCGFSNGGMMSYTVANVASDVFAAFASISGFPLNEFHLRHTSVRPYPFLHIHGKADDFVKYSLVPIIVDNTVARNGCNPVPEVKTVSGKYRKSVYAATEGSFPYVYYEIDGMGHADGTSNTEDGNAAITMWKFMSQYTLETPRNEYLRWKPNIDVEGWEPTKHGWKMNSGTTLLQFGGDQKTDANQNVYRSLQFDNGQYKICFKSESETCTKLRVRIQKLTGKKNSILNDTVVVGTDAVLYFKVTDGWGEYRLTVTRGSSSDVVKITDLAIYALTDEEITSIDAPLSGKAKKQVYNLMGQPASASTKGVVVERSSDGVVRKVLR